MGGGLRMSTAAEGRQVRVRLGGELRGADAVEASRRFDDALYLHPGRGLILDLGELTAVDGDGALLLVRVLELARAERRSVAIVEASDDVEAQLRLVGIISAYGGYPLGRPRASVSHGRL